MKETSKNKPSKNKNYTALSSSGVQMGIVIFGFTFLGKHLDSKFQTETLWTVCLSLLGVFIGLYIVIKTVIDLNKNG